MKDRIEVKRIGYIEFEKFIHSEQLKGSNQDFTNLVFVEPQWAANRNNWPYEYYGIYLDDIIAGYAAMSLGYTLVKIYVSPEHRRKGLAREVVNFLEVSELIVVEGDNDAIRFYCAIGFYIDNQKIGYSILRR